MWGYNARSSHGVEPFLKKAATGLHTTQIQVGGPTFGGIQ